jgi:hypothetical protein
MNLLKLNIYRNYLSLDSVMEYYKNVLFLFHIASASVLASVQGFKSGYSSVWKYKDWKQVNKYSSLAGAYVAKHIPEHTHFNPEDGGGMFSGTSISARKTARCHYPDGHNISSHHRGNLKTYQKFSYN